MAPADPGGRPDSTTTISRAWTAVAAAFIESHDEYPHHWLMHFIHAAEIVGQHHPDAQTRTFWLGLYAEMCRAMHMQPEPIECLGERLADPAAACPPVSPVPQLEKAVAKEQIAWLVEIQPTGGPQWWTGRGDEWTPYVDGTTGNPTLSAIRFAREEDANRAIGWLLEKNLARGAKASEHLWL